MIEEFFHEYFENVFHSTHKTVVDLTTATNSVDDDSTIDDDRIYSTSKFDNRRQNNTQIDWIDKKTKIPNFTADADSNKNNDSDNSNKLFSYPGKGRNKLRHTLNHLNDATILALYGDNFESEPILQIRVSRNYVMACYSDIFCFRYYSLFGILLNDTKNVVKTNDVNSLLSF